MKLTIFGLTLSSAWGNGHATPFRAILRALAELGHSAVFFEKDLPFYAARRDFTTCDYCELVLYPDWEEVRARALREARESDAVLLTSYCPEGARISDEVLALCGPLRVFYDLDTPITLGALEQGGLAYLRREQIPHFDLYLSFTGGGTLNELTRRWGARRAAPLYGCVDPDAHRRTAPRDDLRCDLSYMGTYAADRHQKLEELFMEAARRRPRLRFLLAGAMYPGETPWPANLRRLEHVAPADHPALFSSSRLTLNLTRQGMARWGWCPSGRLFEAAACGTPLVSDAWAGLEAFFTPGEEILLAHDASGVLAALDGDERDLHATATRARQRTLEEHTGERRARQLLAALDEARQPTAEPEPASEMLLEGLGIA